MATAIDSDQKLHLVFGGELQDLDGVRFRDIKGLDIVGIFPDYATAQADRKSTRLNSSHTATSRMPSSA